MLEIISWAFVVFTSLIGIFSIAFAFFEKMLCASSSKDAVMLLPISGHNENVEYIVRSITAKTNTKVFIIDMGIDYETQQICNVLSNNIKAISFLKKDDFLTLINDEQFLKNHQWC
ncbi:MAG: hypothetical protein RR036_03750 [Oscillospiraceae bacterium]